MEVNDGDYGSDESTSDPIPLIEKARSYIYEAEPGKIGTRLIGMVEFEEGDSETKISGFVFGLPQGAHGFHVHKRGDIGDGCSKAGPHYNPNGQSHGHPNDTVRHVGDMKQINISGSGAFFNFIDSVISLNGIHSIIGRSVVIHTRADDYGRGGEKTSLVTGNSGGRLACGVIGIA